MLIGIAGFLVFVGVLVVMMASRDSRNDARGRRIPPERAQILALVFLVAGVALFAYVMYTKAFA